MQVKCQLSRLEEPQTKTPKFEKNFGVFRSGSGGFEPPNAGSKDRCLTTWRRPNCTLPKHFTAPFFSLQAVPVIAKVAEWLHL